MRAPSLPRCAALAFALAAPLPSPAHPVGDWAGFYEYVETGGRTAGGSAIVVQHRLRLAATLTGPACLLDSHGFQTDDEIECAIDRAERGIAIRFRRFARGGPRVPGVVIYQEGETLFTLHRERRGGQQVLITRWQAMRFASGADAGASGIFFAGRPGAAARDLGLFGAFSYIAEQDDCIGRLVWLRRRGAVIEGEIAPYEGPCETVKAAIVQGTYDPKSGALSFLTEPWLGDPRNPVGWRFDGRLDGSVLSGVLRQVVPATGAVRSSPEDAALRRLSRLPARLRE